MSDSEQNEETPKTKKLPLSMLILIALMAGLITGITFGESCSIFQPVGDGFIRLLQMAILPYIMVSLIQGIGGLERSEARKLAARGGAMLGLTWMVAVIVVLALPFAFPATESASFFSTSMIEEPPPVNFLDIYIPANPFFSMANNMIPAVVLFCVMLGIALISNPRKGKLLDALSVIAEGLTTVTTMMVRLTPIGVFALVASASGTLSLGELLKIQVYVISFIAATLLLTFLVLPLLVTALTPFTYKQILKLTQSSLVTGFTTGNLFIILPTLIEGAKQLFRDAGDDSEATMSYVDVLVPVSFNFPSVGKLVMLVFICFAAWFNGGGITAADYPSFIISGILSFFGSVNIAIPFLLDSFGLPADLFQLFVISGIITGYFATLLAAMSLFCITVLGTAAMRGKVHIKLKAFLRWGGASAVGLIAIIFGLGFYFSHSVDDAQERSAVLAGMHRSIMPESDVIVHQTVPEAGSLDNRPVMERLGNGRVRIGYAQNRLPYSFHNGDGELVGYDIDMIADFSRQLECGIELVPVAKENLVELLNNGTIDTAFALTAISAGRERLLNFSDPVLDFTIGLMVPDAEKDRFTTFDLIKENQPLRVAAVAEDVFRVDFAEFLPQSELVDISTMEEFTESEPGTFHAFLGDAESCSAWTLAYPEFSVVVPRPDPARYPAAYTVRQGEEEFLRVINNWLARSKNTRMRKALYDHWILGRGAETKEPRWCLMRNVFHVWE